MLRKIINRCAYGFNHVASAGRTALIEVTEDLVKIG
jgi:hypothetical protein